MALAWSSFTDTGTETLAIEESGADVGVLNRSWGGHYQRTESSTNWRIFPRGVLSESVFVY